MNSPKEISLRFQEIEPKGPQNEAQNELEASYEICVILMNQIPVNLSFTQRIPSVTAQQILNKVQTNLLNGNNDNNKKLAFDEKYKNMFAIWISSTNLELQLQLFHKPYKILANWDTLLKRYGPIEMMTNHELIEKDEPILNFQRNVFSDKQKEKAIELADIGALRLLYLESKYNVLNGRYPSDNYEKLAAIQAALDLRPFNKNKHNIEYFRQHLNEFIPCNYIKSKVNNSNKIIRTLSRSSQLTRFAENIVNQLEEIFKNESTEYKLLKKYMEICWSIPCYGSAFFTAQIEKPVKSTFALLMDHFDRKVWIAINREGIHMISKESCELLLSIEYNRFCWEVGSPSDSSNPNCIPCLFIQIPDNSNLNILQIFSRQIKLIVSLLNTFIEDFNRSDDFNQNSGISTDCTDGSHSQISDSVSYSVSNTGLSFNGSDGSTTPCNTKKLTFATFDNSGKCINKTGSWLRKKTDIKIK